MFIFNEFVTRKFFFLDTRYTIYEFSSNVEKEENDDDDDDDKREIDMTVKEESADTKAAVVKELVREACEENGYRLESSVVAKKLESFSEKTKNGVTAIEDFLRLAVHEVKEYARPPTSNFHVGAACLTTRGNIFFGVNVEVEKCALNRSVHAEQCMIMNAKFHLDGASWTKNNGRVGTENDEKEKITKIAITHAPCGHCRQFMNELRDAKDIQILLPGMEATRLEELLPQAFGPLDLEVPGDEEHREDRIKRRKSEGSAAIVVDDEEKTVHVRTLLLDGCPPNPRDPDGLGTMEKFCKLLREAAGEGTIRKFDNVTEYQTAVRVIEKLAHTMAHSYAPYTDSPCAIAIPVFNSGDGTVDFHFVASAECAAYNPSMTPVHAMQVALHCTPSRPPSYKKSAPEYENIENRPILWSQGHAQLPIFVFGFDDAKISYTETLKKEFEDISRRHGSDGTASTIGFRVHEFLFDRHMFDREDFDPEEYVNFRQYSEIFNAFIESKCRTFTQECIKEVEPNVGAISHPHILRVSPVNYPFNLYKN